MSYRGIERHSEIARSKWKIFSKGKACASGNVDRLRLSKFEYGSLAAAVLAYIAVRQGDRAGIAIVSDTLKTYQPPARGMERLYSTIKTIDQITPQGGTGLMTGLDTLGMMCREKGMLVIVSDLITDTDQMFRSLQTFVSRKFHVVLVQILTDEELSLSGFREETEFKDPETSSRVLVDLQPNCEDYTEEMHDWLGSIQQKARQLGISYSLISTSATPEAALPQLVQQINR